MSVPFTWVVKLEFKRLQTFLFEAPKLKAMIGANAMVGEILRGSLSKTTFIEFEGRPNLPFLAVKCGAGLPADVMARLAKLQLPQSNSRNDPLHSSRDLDDPQLAYQNGILSRDGGHLHIVFANSDVDAARADAERFVQQARQLVGNTLPGLLLATRLLRLQFVNGVWQEPDTKECDELDDATATDFVDLPQFQVCEITGRGPASHRKPYKEPTGQMREHRISATVQMRERRATAFDKGQSGDLLGLLRQPMAGKLELPQAVQEHVFPNEFEDVAPSGDLAVIVADGNRVGSRSKEWRVGKPDEQDFFTREAHNECFFHAMRVAVRKAVLDTLRLTFLCVAERIREGSASSLPFRIMMLGGDDLLLVCDAIHAMTFAEHYAKELEKHKLADGDPLHIGMGIAIVKKTFPFHRAHALAEQLASSAKRLFRSLPAEQKVSTVDWLAVTEAWHEDINDVRRRDFIRRYRIPGATPSLQTLVLSRKPYRILGKENSLAALRHGAVQAARSLPRGQLIGLAEAVEKGYLQADWAVRLLGPDRSQWLRPILQDKGRSIWHTHANGHYSTALLDFLELFELEHQGQKQQSEASAKLEA